MSAPSDPKLNQPNEINLEITQTPDLDRGNFTAIKSSETSQQHNFSARSFVYAAHAILIVITLGLINWLSSASSISSNMEFQFSQHLHQTLISSSW